MSTAKIKAIPYAGHLNPIIFTTRQGYRCSISSPSTFTDKLGLKAPAIPGLVAHR
ncbi:hypothetical protein DSO57_1014374 [Entomophthora muscae]|uniref:Uncharacterized protein n=1 Tax=Entomophthora muscae TaxID=34485 RepID=A0ACC2SUM5_9FUNG|nr:hypothetical protein DSO57_1014374 [Entomophthora muscae]